MPSVEPDQPPPALPAAATELPVDFGDFELLEQVGRGAMGVVFRARQKSLDRIVALKLLDLTERIPADATTRFRSEAAAAARLHHPGIVGVHEVGEHAGRQFIAMDFVEGKTLDDVVSGRPLHPRRAASIVAAVADAVQAAHDRGILHRDLKPSNILIDARDRPHVADFGLAKRLDVDADATMPGRLMGSPNFMSPEQARGAALGFGSDLHALGAVLYHALTGHPPFLGATIAETLYQVIHAEPVSPRLLVAGISRDFETIALKCLRKDPAQRYAAARDLADDLRAALRHAPIRARPIGPAERAWRWCRRRPAVAALSAVTGVLVLAVAIGSPIAALRIRAESERAQDNLYAADMNLAQRALERSSRNQALALLERHRPRRGDVDRRGFDWRYLWGRTASDERPLVQAAGGMRHLVAIPQSTLFAVGNQVFDTAALPQPVRELPAGSVAMAWSPLDRTLLAGGFERFVACSLETGALVPLLEGEAVHTVALSSDGRWMATGGTRLHLWSSEGGSWRRVASRERAFKVWHNAKTLAFSPDGGLLVTGTGESWANRCLVELWSVPLLEPEGTLPAMPGDVVALAFTPQERRLIAGCWNGRMRMWDIDSRTEIATAMRHDGFPGDLKFAPGDPNVLATTASDRTVRLWDVRTGAELVALQGAVNHVWAMDFADDGRTILTLDHRRAVAAWDAATRRRREVLTQRGPVTAPLGFSGDSAVLATIDETGRLRYWSVDERRELRERARTIDLTGVYTRDFEIIAPVVTRDLRILALGRTDGGVMLHDLDTGSVRTFPAHGAQVRNLAFEPDGRLLATAGDDGMLRLWDVGTLGLVRETSLRRPLANEDFNLPLVWSSDGRQIAVAGADAVTVYDAGTTRVRCSFDTGVVIFSLRFTPDDAQLLVAQDDFRLSFWDARTGHLQGHAGTSHQEGPYEMRFSPDTRTLVTVVDHVTLWSAATRQEVATLRGHDRNIFAALFSPDGNTLVTADYDGCIRVWSAPPFEMTDG